ncbi:MULTISPECIES: lysophospholipid acyltransferase family protein [unclassified Streptomyces]|uniref:lysophospholipid acyltransferase family protein n=1 Tax=unclassified Streptomyces TaxID=2593676 RepID=UPI002E27C92C|nr:lysophospholipid acyltransferase family protein [Streptomyces sp. NBC_00334]
MDPYKGSFKVGETVSTSFRHWVARRHVDAVEGLGHIPAEGPFIVVSNHLSFFDHYLLETVLYGARGRHVYFPAKAANFHHPVKRLVRMSVGCIPLDSDRPDRNALTAMKEVLEGGDVLCTYPEGTRWTGGGLAPFHDGPFYFAVRTGVPVVPVMIHGADRILPKGEVVPHRATARLVFGPRLTAAPRGRTRAAVIADLRTRTRDRMERLGERARTAHGRPDEDAALAVRARAEEIAAAACVRGRGLDRTEQRRIAVLHSLARATTAPRTAAPAPAPVAATA